MKQHLDRLIDRLGSFGLRMEHCLSEKDINPEQWWEGWRCKALSSIAPD